MERPVSQPINQTHRLLIRMQRWPAGLWLFSKLVCLKAPYFASIRPRFVELRPGFGRATAAKRRRVTNHLGTVHAIAMANLCEYVAGTLMETSIRPEMRWIPKGMNIRYLALARSAITATCMIDNVDWQAKQDVELELEVHDEDGTLVAQARVPMYVSPRK